MQNVIMDKGIVYGEGYNESFPCAKFKLVLLFPCDWRFQPLTSSLQWSLGGEGGHPLRTHGHHCRKAHTACPLHRKGGFSCLGSPLVCLSGILFTMPHSNHWCIHCIHSEKSSGHCFYSFLAGFLFNHRHFIWISLSCKYIIFCKYRNSIHLKMLFRSRYKCLRFP